MKKIAIVLALLALLVAGAALWGLSNATLDITAEDVLVMPADSQQGEFDRLMDLLDHNALRGTVFEQQVSGNAEDYTILRYALRVKNKGLIPARMLEVTVLPVKGDVLSYSHQDAAGQDVNQAIDLGPGQEMRLYAYLLTKRDMHAVRELHITYYIWGHPYLVKVTYG